MTKTTMTKTTTERDEAIERLRAWLKPGDTVWTIMRYCSPSRTRRTIDLVKLSLHHPAYSEEANADGEVKVLALSYTVALALGLKFDRDRDGVQIEGCGEDMGFRLVYELGRALFNDGNAFRHKWL